MNIKSPPHLRSFTTLFVIACIAAVAVFVWQFNYGLSFWDEGFLWYGVQRTMLGEMPIRDFGAYDIGRYYFFAWIMQTMGNDGIIALRFSTLILQILAIFGALNAVTRMGFNDRKVSTLLLAVYGMIFSLWTYPRYKTADIAVSTFLVCVVAYFIAKPTLKRAFITGVTVGFAAVWGRNHGLYAAAGSFAALLFCFPVLKSNAVFLKSFCSWSAGIVIGFSPNLLAMLFIDGYGKAFLDNITYQVKFRSTNLPLPVPWPWTFQLTSLINGSQLREFLIGVLFLAILGYCCAGIALVVRQIYRRETTHANPLLTSSVFLSIPYAHYIFSRADIDHLATGFFPVLIGISALITMQRRFLNGAVAMCLLGLSFYIILPMQPGWYCHHSPNCQTVAVNNDKLIVDNETANDVLLLNELVRRFTPNNEAFLATPFWPGAYALFTKKSPMWDIYALLPRDPSFERDEIERIRKTKPRFVLIFDFPLDGREDLRFKNTHPLTNAYIAENYLQLPGLTKNANYKLYVPTDSDRQRQ